MSTPFENLDSTFDVHAEVVDGLQREEIIPGPQSKRKSKDIVKNDPVEDRDKDYTYVRSKYYSLFEKAEELIEEAMENAIQSGHPRAFEVALKGIRDASDLGDKMMDLHKKAKDLNGEEVKVQQTNIQNNIAFGGTMSDLTKLLGRPKDK